MKRVMTLLLSLTMAAALLAGCGSDKTTGDTTDTTGDTAAEDTAQRLCFHRRFHLYGGGHRRSG